MLVRAYRLSDRFSVAFLKVNAWLWAQALEYAAALTGRVWAFLAAVRALMVTTARRAYTAQAALAARAQTRAAQVQARAHARLGGGVAPDMAAPLRMQVRLLSAFTVLVLGALMVFILWSTSPGNALGGGGASLGQLPPLATRVPPATLVPTPLPTPTAIPDPLRVGGSIAYTMRVSGQDDIFAVSIGQGSALQLTNDPTDDRDPAWSPDGTKLAFASRRDGNWELYALDTHTGETFRLTDDPDFQGGPSWSPDGQWVVYESYKDNNLDLYIVKVDRTEGPYRLTYDPAPDFEPAWSPGGRHIAYTSWRAGSQDIYIISLDDPNEQSATNLTNTPDIDEDYAAWAPNGLLVAYSAPQPNGVEIVYARPFDKPDAEPLVIGQGRQPTWAPNGASLVFAAAPAGQQRNYLVAGQFGTFGVASAVLEFGGNVSDPDWSGIASAEQLVSWGGVQAAAAPLYEEEITYESDAAPRYRLAFLTEVDAPQAYLSDRVDGSFNALRAAALNRLGFDLLGALSEAWWPLDRLPQAGEELQNWHYTGRAIALNRNLTLGYPPTAEAVREEVGAETYWRVYLRAQVQNGLLGEPLRRRPWQFAYELPRTRENLPLYNQGGARKDAIPPGYYVDLTQLAADYGWNRVAAGYDWPRNFNSVRFWEFVKTQNLTWQEAMLEIHPPDAVTPLLGTTTTASSEGGS